MDLHALFGLNFREEQIETYEYNLWGVLLKKANKNNLLNTGWDFDFDINLQFNRMRYYSPNLGRFLQKDPLTLFGYYIRHFIGDKLGFGDTDAAYILLNRLLEIKPALKIKVQCLCL